MARVFVFKIPNFVHVCPNPCTIYTQTDVIIFQYLFFTPYYYQLTTVGENHPYMEEKGIPSSFPQGEGGCKSRPHFKIAFFTYMYVYPVIFTGAAI